MKFILEITLDAEPGIEDEMSNGLEDDGVLHDIATHAAIDFRNEVAFEIGTNPRHITVKAEARIA